MTAGRWIKRIGIALLALVLLLFAAVATALVLVDTQALRGVIEKRVEATTGRELRIEGELEISLFPWLGFELGRTRLANAEGFGDDPMAALERAELRVRVLPLLTGDVALDRVVLHGLQANLARDRNGRTNWADLADAAGDEAAAQPEPDAAPAEDEGGTAMSLRIEGVDLRDATLTWQDAANDQDLRISALELTTGALEAGTPTPVELAFRLTGEGLPQVDLAATTELTFYLDGPRIELTGLTSEVDASGEALPGGALQAGLAGDVLVDAGAGTAVVDNLVLTAFDILRATGGLDARFGDAGTGGEGRLTVAPFDPRALADALGAGLPELADADVPGEFAMELAFAGTPAAIDIKRIEGQLDDTRFTGSATLKPGDIPDLQAQLELDAIDIERYLPAGEGSAGDDGDAGASGDGEDGGDAGTAADPVESLPLEALRGVKADLRAGIGRVGYNDFDMNDVKVRIELADGVLRLRQAELSAAGGRMGLSGTLDASTDRPAASLATEIAGIKAEPLLTAFAGSAPVVGQLDSSVTVNTAGADLDAWTRALAGRFDATFTDGAIRGINLARTLRTASARLSGGDVEEAGAERQTDFSVMRVSGRIRDGVVKSNELDLRSPLLRVSGAGEASLPARTLDYTARIKVTSSLAGQGGEAAEELSGLEIPVRFNGAWNDPAIDVRLSEALAGRAERKAEQRKEEAKKEAEEEIEKEKDKAEKKIKDKLKGIFD